MVNAATISAINKVVNDYLSKSKIHAPIPVKDLMPQFIAAGIFPKDENAGLPIHKILRQMDKENLLHLIHYVLPQRKQKNTNWFFTSKASNTIPIKSTANRKPLATSKTKRQASDETYVIDLCDEIIRTKSLRQHKFDFLLGDKNKTGKQSKLPVDAYYPTLNLVIEYREQQHTKPVAHFDKPHIKTVSGVHRGEQRKIYDQRRREILPQNGIKLIEIPYDLFNTDSGGRIIRDKINDIYSLMKFIKKP